MCNGASAIFFTKSHNISTGGKYTRKEARIWIITDLLAIQSRIYNRYSASAVLWFTISSEKNIFVFLKSAKSISFHERHSTPGYSEKTINNGFFYKERN